MALQALRPEFADISRHMKQHLMVDGFSGFKFKSM